MASAFVNTLVDLWNEEMTWVIELTPFLLGAFPQVLELR